MHDIVANEPGPIAAPRERRFSGNYYTASQQPASTEQLGVTDLVRTFARHRLLVLGTVIVVALATLAWQLTSPKLYRAKANIQVELIDETGTNQADALAKNSQRLANESKLYRSRTSAHKVVEKLNLLENPVFLKQMGGKPIGTEAEQISEAVSVLLATTDVKSEEGSDLIEFSATARSPELAAKIANTFPEAVGDLKRSRDTKRRRELMNDLEAEREDRMARAVEAAEALAKFRVANRMLVGAGGAEDLAQINRISTEAASAAAQGSGSAAQSAGIAQAAGLSTTLGATSAAVQQLQRQEAELSAQNARLSQTYGSGYPELARVQTELQSVRASLAREQDAARRAAQAQASVEGERMRQLARAEAAGSAARAGQLQSVVASMTSRAFANTANTPLLEQLEREALTTAAAVASIAEQMNRVESEKLVEGVSSNIISPATPDRDAISPAPLKTTAVAVTGAAVLAMIIAFLIDLMDDRLRTAAQIRKYFGLPVFGMLPSLTDGYSSKLRESPVITEPHSIFAEVARSVYSEVRSLMPSNQSQSVLVTSPMPGDGKSVTALTIAAAALTMGKRAVILDLDLRRSGILQRIQQDMDAPELIDVIRGNVDVHGLIAPPNSSGEMTNAGFEVMLRPDADEMLSRFMLLSASQPIAEPAAVLTSPRFQQLVADLKKDFDIVVVNAPAVLAVRDARSMSDYTDDTIIVVKWGETNIDQLRATLELLGSGNVAGCVFNQVDYADHARRKYGDSIQYYHEAADYFSGAVPARLTLRDEFMRLFRRKPLAA
ncbi:Wzz/FepE/Etk N-terminal domain-containing protein [Parerythrobacter aurantius]|uniref:GumC family protein n=1 Tax=Parerythrobacter aurantius TaxID=3127706 RepID=UPI003247072E